MFSLLQTLGLCVLSSVIVVSIFAAVDDRTIPTSQRNETTPVAQTPELPSGIEVLCIEGYKFVRDMTGNGSLVQFMHNGNYPKECK
jgi:hypothetical protein